MNILKLTAIAGLPLMAGMLGGCVTRAGAHVRETVVYHEPFKSLYSHRQIRLQHPLVLLPGRTEPIKETASTDSAVLIDVRDSRVKRVPLDLPESLPAGTVIEFDRFDKERTYAYTVFPFFLDLFPSPPSYTTWFTVPHLNLPKDVYFEYCWGHGAYLWPAPWESKDGPRKYVGTNGHRYKPKPR